LFVCRGSIVTIFGTVRIVVDKVDGIIVESKGFVEIRSRRSRRIIFIIVVAVAFILAVLVMMNFAL
jgi:uncharacterized membrane protein